MNAACTCGHGRNLHTFPIAGDAAGRCRVDGCACDGYRAPQGDAGLGTALRRLSGHCDAIALELEGMAAQLRVLASIARGKSG